MLNIPPDRIEGETSYAVPGFTTVHNIPPEYVDTIFLSIGDYLKQGGEMVDFDGKRKINKNKVYTVTLLIEYDDVTLLERDKIANQAIQMKNPFQAIPIDETRQVGENIGDFEWNGKYYLVLHTYNSYTTETLSERGIFKGVIVDMEKYNNSKSKPEKLESQVIEKVGNIFPHKD